MTIPTEPIGSVPRPDYLIEAMGAHASGGLDDAGLGRAMDRAVAETVAAMEATGSTVITDGEQSKPSFATYPLAGLAALAPEGVVISFEDGRTRQLPVLTAGPFRYTTYSGCYVAAAKAHTGLAVKQAVIAPSAISMIYPEDGIDGYSRDDFIADLVNECEKDIRSAFDAGADSVQTDFTEGRLCCKLDPSRGLLRAFVGLNNQVLARFSDAERGRPGQVVYVGVTDPIDPRVESAEEVCERILEAAGHLGTEGLGSTDDCGFSPFGDDVPTARETAFAKIRARVAGTRLAETRLG